MARRAWGAEGRRRWYAAAAAERKKKSMGKKHGPG
jgi:hypothetical protein